VGLDVSSTMLAEARKTDTRAALLLGDVSRLPFPDARFDAVVCCRLLHHLAEPAALALVLGELVRVSRGLVIASFWDAGSLPAWRQTLFPSARAPGRWARSRADLEQAFARAGAEVVGWKHSLRFVTRQAFVAARKRAAR
jgi:SAM-dependent methyltransferase